VDTSRLRVLIVPALPGDVSDSLRDAWEQFGVLLTFADAALDCVAFEVDVALDDAPKALGAAAKALARASKRAFRFEAPAALESQHTQLGNALSQALAAPVWVAQRSVPASQWLAMRPLEFGVDGFAVRAGQPAIACSKPRNLGIALEFGDPLVVLRAGLNGVPPTELARIRDAVGSERGGLLHIGAAPTIAPSSGEPLLVLSCSDPVKSPLHRALELIDIEAARCGGALGSTALLSSVPLQTLLGSLAARMGLAAKPAQIIETNLPKPPRPAPSR
jgi:hypothetical protein